MEENQSKRNKTVKFTFDKKFGVSENIHSRKGNGRDARDNASSRAAERRPFKRSAEGEDKAERKSFDKPFERRRSFGDRKPFGERKTFGERAAFGDRRTPRKPFDRSERFNRSERRNSSRSNRFESESLTPIFRQRPQTKPVPDFETQKDEAVLEQNALLLQESPDEQTPPWFKKVLALTTEKGREREGNFLGEGLHVVQELVTHHRDLVQAVYYAESFQDKEFLNTVRNAGVALHDISDELMEKASTTVTSQGIFAVCRMASHRPDYEASRSVLTIVDAVQDPGNLGTLFRTSLGFSSNGMILGKGTVSAFNPKVVRGSSGTFLRVPFEADVDLIERINFLRQKGYMIVATDLHAKQTLRDLPPRKLRKIAFLVGNEGAGANSYLIELADETVKIPMSSDLESLNVAVAHGILSYEIAALQKEV